MSLPTPTKIVVLPVRGIGIVLYVRVCKSMVLARANPHSITQTSNFWMIFFFPFSLDHVTPHAMAVPPDRGPYFSSLDE